MRIRQQNQFEYGYNSITEMDGKHSDMLMDFGLLRLDAGQEIVDRDSKERAFVLVTGEVEFEWENSKVVAKRASCFDEGPFCLHVPADVSVRISSFKRSTELSVHKTANGKGFAAKLFTPKDCRIEQRGTGTMKEMGTRISRTIFDKSNRENSNFVLGEGVGYPGRWLSYPPHHHPQPEIYFYKFNIENGYGYSEVGEDVFKVRNNDAVLFPPGMTHPQVTIPGYAMYYVWIIRHLENLPYISPIYLPEYTWVMDKDALIWPDK